MWNKHPRTLVYCGLNRCGSFDRLVRRFDVAYGFEAIPELAEAAADRYRSMDGVHIVHAALAEKDGPVEFFVHDESAASSLGRLGKEYCESTRNDIRVERQLQVPGLNLCKYLQDQGVRQIDLYVSDIQGMDFTVLKSMEPYLSRQAIRKIVCETERDQHQFEAYEGLPSNRLAQFENLLGSDYVISKRQKVEEHWAYQDVTWRLRLPHLVRWYFGDVANRENP